MRPLTESELRTVAREDMIRHLAIAAFDDPNAEAIMDTAVEMMEAFLYVSESYTPLSGSIRIETSVFRKMAGYMHAPWSSALPSAVKLGTVISQRIRYIALSSTEEAFNRSWIPYQKYFPALPHIRRASERRVCACSVVS